MREGFTLAELLIALAILGVIATFTIPKVLNSQQDGKYKAMAKEAASTVSGAFQAYKKDKPGATYFGTVDLTPYLNYVRLDTTSSIDGHEGEAAGLYTCGNTYGSFPECLVLHNGGILYYFADYLCNTTDKTALHFRFDPDGKGDGKAKALAIFVYDNGRLATWEGLENNTRNGWDASGTCNVSTGPSPSLVPPWFGWD